MTFARTKSVRAQVWRWVVSAAAIGMAAIVLVGCESSPRYAQPQQDRPAYITEIYRSPIGTGSVYSVEQ